jgi:hypothetical protein
MTRKSIYDRDYVVVEIQSRNHALLVREIAVPNYGCARIRAAGLPAVPNTERPLPIECPKCQYGHSKLVVKSLTIMMVKCANCGHSWATTLDALQPDIQEKVHAVLRDA